MKARSFILGIVLMASAAWGQEPAVCLYAAGSLRTTLTEIIEAFNASGDQRSTRLSAPPDFCAGASRRPKPPMCSLRPTCAIRRRSRWRVARLRWSCLRREPFNCYDLAPHLTHCRPYDFACPVMCSLTTHVAGPHWQLTMFVPIAFNEVTGAQVQAAGLCWAAAFPSRPVRSVAVPRIARARVAARVAAILDLVISRLPFRQSAAMVGPTALAVAALCLIQGVAAVRFGVGQATRRDGESHLLQEAAPARVAVQIAQQRP